MRTGNINMAAFINEHTSMQVGRTGIHIIPKDQLIIPRYILPVYNTASTSNAKSSVLLPILPK